MSETVPHQPGMLLGRTFDLSNSKPGLDLFPKESLDSRETQDKTSTAVRYSVITNSSDVNKILEVSGDISLKCKAGVLDVGGMGSYLKEDRSKENTLEIIAKAHVETMTESMTDLTPKSGWTENVVGTHFIRSITYGGDLICRIRIEGSDAKHIDEIKAKVKSGLPFQGILDVGAKANFRKMEQDLKETSNIDISYYSTTLQGQMPRDIDGMLEILDGFKDQVLKLNNGKGCPLRCELLPLSYLDNSLSNVIRDKATDVKLKTLEEYYDDVMEGRARLKRLMERDDVLFTSEQETSACDIEERMDSVLDIFNDVISTLDVTTAGDGPSQMNQAFKKYREEKKLGGFKREVADFLKTAQGPIQTPIEDLPTGEGLAIVLVGKTGHGKSATANTIFSDQRFKSKMSSSSVTAECQKEHGVIGNRELCVVDTPGMADTRNVEKALEEVGTAVALVPDGYHAFLIVLRVDARMTREEEEAISALKKLFGEDLLIKYAILVFTHGDLFLKKQKVEPDLTFENFIKSQQGNIMQLVSEVKDRCILINNEEEDLGKKRKEIINLIKTIDKLVEENGSKYTNHLFNEVKKVIEEEKRKEEEERKKREKEANARIEAARREGFEAAKREEEAARKEEAEREEKAEAERTKKGAETFSKTAEATGGGCFPGDGLVQREGGERVKMKDLTVGDKVFVGLSDGKQVFSEVYFFGHRDQLGIGEYIDIRTPNASLKMTPNHYVYIVDDGHMYTVRAGSIQIGDWIMVYRPESGHLSKECVVQLTTSSEVGLFSPLTVSGKIVVNNILVSCYCGFFSPGLSQSLLSPVRQVYRLSPSISMGINSVCKNGIPGWVKWCMEKFNPPL